MAEPPPGFVPLERRRQARRTQPPPGFVPKGQASAAEPSGRSWVRRLDDINRSLASGVMLGYHDEFAAGLGALTGFPSAPEGQGGYEPRLAAQRARQAEIPAGIRIPGEIAGAVGAAVAAAPLAAGTKVAQGLAKLPGWLRAAVIGAGWGGTFGFGTGEGGPQERLKSAAGGAAGGALLGPPLHYAGQGASWAGGQVRKFWQEAHDPTAAAKRAIQGAFTADRTTPAMAAARMQRHGPETILADVGGPNVRGVARATAATPGPAQARATTVLNRRAQGEEEAIAQAVKKGLDPNDFYAAKDAFLLDMKQRASPLYEQAYAQHERVISPALSRAVEGPTGRRAMREAAALIADDRASGVLEASAADALLTQLALVPKSGAPVLSLRAWNYVKMGVDSMLDKPSLRNEITGRLNTRGRAIDAVRRTVLKELDAATGGAKGTYARARAIWAGDASAISALTAGRKAIKSDPERIVRDLKALSKASQQAYRTGYARAIMDSIDDVARTGTSTASLARRVIGSSRRRKRLRAVFPDHQSYREFTHLMAVKVLQHETQTAVLAGSRTTPMLLEKSAVSGAAGTAGALMGAQMAGGSGGIIVAGIRSRLGRRIMQGLLGREDPRYYTELGRMLFSMNRAENRAVLAHLQKFPPAKRAPILADILAVTGGIGSAQTELGGAGKR